MKKARAAKVKAKAQAKPKAKAKVKLKVAPVKKRPAPRAAPAKGPARPLPTRSVAPRPVAPSPVAPKPAAAKAVASKPAKPAPTKAAPKAATPKAVTAPATALRIDLARARAHWLEKQGLGAPIGGAPEEVVAATGWPRTLGGADVYLAVKARVPGLSRKTLDEAVEASRLQVIPAVRSCIYLVPRAEVPLVLKVAEEQYRKRTEREMQKLGVDDKELAALGAEVIKALRPGPMAPDALRAALPEGAVRNLGDKGRKLGVASPLPAALRYLEFEGKVERTLAGGRLDSERYDWRLPASNPFAGAKVPADAVERNAAIARRFFRSAGPATVNELCNWAGQAQKDARDAMARLPLVPVTIDDFNGEAFVLEEDLPLLRAPAPDRKNLSFLPFEDNFIVLHGGPRQFVDPRHHGRSIPVWGTTRGTTLGEATHMSMRALVEGDHIAGLWEYDPDAKQVVFGTFEPLPPARRKAAEQQAEELGRFLREELGHAKSFVLDTESALRERARLVKAL
jgi:hypothetical protein